jgi:hypothetical protein
MAGASASAISHQEGLKSVCMWASRLLEHAAARRRSSGENEKLAVDQTRDHGCQFSATPQ